MKKIIPLLFLSLLSLTDCTTDEPSVVTKPDAFESLMMTIPAGTFQMGSDDWIYTQPIHTVTLLNSFKMSKYEVTQQQWRDVMGTNPSYFTDCDSCPVEQVSWHDAQNFLQKLKVLTGKNYRLPTEAEWEYAARGGQSYLYAGSDDINAIAWYQDNAYLVGLGSPNYGTNPVGQKSPNGYGLYDMNGNVFEMCQDGWNADYNGAPADGSAWTSVGNQCVLRGGSWFHRDFISNSFYRINAPKSNSSNDYGFRIAL